MVKGLTSALPPCQAGRTILSFLSGQGEDDILRENREHSKVLPRREQIHKFLYIAPIFKNKVTFLAQDIYNNEKSHLTQLKFKNMPYLGHFSANFDHFSSFLESHRTEWPTTFLVLYFVLIFLFLRSYSWKYTHYQ